jgi:hypothetical protein
MALLEMNRSCHMGARADVAQEVDLVTDPF